MLAPSLRIAPGVICSLHRLLVLVTALLAVLIAFPWLFTLAGDAQVHLAVAEQFSRGHPFQYNSGGETVIASTSPFWTLLLAVFFWAVGAWTPVLLKIIVVALWLATGYVLYRTARDIWGMRGGVLLAVVGLWFTQTMITANALGGLENILSAFQVVWLYDLTSRWRTRFSAFRAVVLGGLFGWAALTRPDGALFAGGVLALFLLATRLHGHGSFAGWFGYVVVLVLVALVVLLPGYVYQYEVTGKWLTDSSLARLYTGRRGSIALLANLIYIHPKSIVSLFTAFLPLMVGCAIMFTTLVGESRRGAQVLARCYPQTVALATVILALFFYTFVVGGDSFARYFLPIFPFCFLAGIAGLAALHDLLPRRRVTRASVLLTLTALFLLTISGLDMYRRVIVERFDDGPTLNIIYGPASGKYFALNLGDIIAAPQDRAVRTAALRHALGVSGGERLRFAVTEVQLRYFVDDSIDILSLDGRASAEIMPYFEPATGLLDFEAYFRAARPDLVHVAQWCYVGDWRANVLESNFPSNLVCDWQERAARMQTGDSFEWNGHLVTLVAPDIMRILWKAN